MGQSAALAVDEPDVGHRLVVTGHLADPGSGYSGREGGQGSTGRHQGPTGLPAHLGAVSEGDADRPGVGNEIFHTLIIEVLPRKAKGVNRTFHGVKPNLFACSKNHQHGKLISSLLSTSYSKSSGGRLSYHARVFPPQPASSTRNFSDCTTLW